jgi:hypothetical protein
MSDEQTVPTFEMLISELSPDSKERLMNEFCKLSRPARESFNQLFALAYVRGQINGADAMGSLVDKAMAKSERDLRNEQRHP